MCVYIGLLQPQCERVAIEALQLCTLLLPPASRRKLQLLMRMMSRISQNVDMPRLHPAIGTRTLVGNKTDAIWNLQTNRHICSPVTLNYFQGINDISSLIFHFLFALIIVFVLVFIYLCPFLSPCFFVVLLQMVHTFSGCVLGSAVECDLDELLATRLVSFLMDHHQSILSVPEYLLNAINDHIQYLRRVQVHL